MIKTSDFNVCPAQLEAAFYRHPLVAEACIVGVPDPARIEPVSTCVVLKDASRSNPETAAGHDAGKPPS